MKPSLILSPRADKTRLPVYAGSGLDPPWVSLSISIEVVDGYRPFKTWRDQTF